ncbi:ATP-binding protein [Brevundimonas sp. M20]|uniref:ATP-binding protein n=1 Tax=Brevundimonas sp. M20 TaxID=2591463 RepID=UPI001146BA5F|nr:ATP-binding protein [Brevundimonas sp. M20]QDH72049.1 response regulator [Brevundimonas sp. M20]
MGLYATIAPHLTTSARERRGQVLVRIILGAMICWMLHAAGWSPLIGPWLALTAAVQVLEWWALAPFRAGAGPEVERHAVMLPAIGSTALMAGIHAGAAVVIWSSGDQILSTTAVLIVVGGTINNLASGIESRILFLIGTTPYAAALVAMPVTRWLNGGTGELPLLFGCVLLFFGAILSVWSRVHAARMAEIAALGEASVRLEQAEAAMADRAAMAAIVSHELRTPVSAILAGAHVIRHGDRPEATPETADLIIDAGRLMTGMLNDLLDHSKIEARAMTLETRDFDLSALLADTARFWSAPAKEKGLTLTAPGDGEALWLKGDPYRLRQILNNLISNAIKFTEKGVVALEATVEGEGERRTVTLTVRDQGTGIAPEAMSRLFTPFAQGSAEVARTYGGTGLGLVVSRDLARLMGGELTAASVAGEGAAFTLSLSLPTGVAVAAQTEADTASPRLDRRLRVLAVDDHEINRRTLSLVLQPLDVELVTASDGHMALEALATRTFDVVLMDVNMPGIDGNETTRRLRASEGINAAVPVIGFSAGTEAAQIAACHAAGMNDWLAKPLEPARLYAALDKAIHPTPPDTGPDTERDAA